MDVKTLSLFVTKPDTHRKVLGSYQGGYSLGVGRDADHGEGPVLVLQVEGAPRHEFPSRIKLGGEFVPLVVKGSFVPPAALSRAR
jgi:hypothetical protein